MKKHQMFETVTAELHRHLFPNSSIKQNQFLMGRSGVVRQIDILIEDLLGVYPIKVVVDCKDYKSKVDIGTVAEVWDIIQDVQANLGIIICNAGYTEGAIKSANQKGLIRLCSILDLQNRNFSIKVAMPVLAEKRDPDFTVSIKPRRLSFCIKPNLKEVLIRNAKTGELSNILKYFYSLLRTKGIDIQNGGFVEIPASDWEMVTSFSNEQFEGLRIAYRFVSKYYLGMVPAIEGKGILDVQSQMLTFNNMFLQPINIAEIQDRWEKYERLEDVKVTPFCKIGYTDYDADLDENDGSGKPEMVRLS